MKTYLFQWGGYLPPFQKYAIFLLCGFEIIISAMSMAVAQKYYELCTILFPIAMFMFDDTKRKGIAGFIWTNKERQILRNHEQKLLLLWCSSTAVIFIAMLSIIPFFFKFKKSITTQERKFRLLIIYILVALFIITVSLNGAAMIWLYITASADNKLFYELFEKSAKEEIFLTEIEKGLDCISDDDKELDPTIECDNTINRSVISRKWLKPLLIIWIVGHVIVLFLFGFINKDFKDDENEGNLKNVAIKEKLIS
ncbi:MFS-type transporter pgmG [Dirofilaria immitis]